MERIEELDQKLSELDPFIRATILGIGVEEIIQHVAPDYSLKPAQIDQLISEVYFYLSGVTDNTEFTMNVEEHLELDEKTEGKFFEDLNKHIFVPIRTEIRRYYEERQFEQDFQQEQESSQQVAMQESENLADRERQTLEGAGIEMVEESPAEESYEDPEDRDKLLAEVENPTKAKMLSWREKKQEQKQHLKPEKNDYSVGTRSVDEDPYREPIPEDDQ